MTHYTPAEIKAERDKRDWTQRKLADMIGVTPVSVSKWENDQSEPSYNHMKRLHEIFTRGAPDPDRLGELEGEISRLRGELLGVQDLVLRLMQAVRSDRRELLDVLIAEQPPIAGETREDEAPPIEPRSQT